MKSMIAWSYWNADDDDTYDDGYDQDDDYNTVGDDNNHYTCLFSLHADEQNQRGRGDGHLRLCDFW